ncbi:hypothetical protein G6F46_005343 [Rhizopus delemar]|nr:hypothetical protein G6F55_007737 [Rhizopus delemar]KAG1540216.1 hypothetical protein G6F51_008660 [Rhizopus arrhizus]KAG1493779.1 hypothetical protein G6F54_008337 [Rhizopus delemar]KAG1508408.1 hypothetical protein G6F53_008210 [Rhizopus delemar]KAG1550073.1 hypothetical protein G6F49_009400 [Rhizopus delemar]
MKSINKHLDLKKITKNNARSEIFSISLKRSNQIKEAKQQRHSSDIGSIARQLKRSLSKATQKLNGSHSDTPSVSNSDWPIKKPQLLHLQLLKQYLTFVSCETKTIVNKENSSIQFTFNEQENKTHQPSHLGAAMIEHLVHNNNTFKRQSNEDGRSIPNLVNRTADRRRPGRPPKTKMTFEDDIKCRNNQKKEDVIQCICSTPQDEFGAMVQCDDCLSWLHVECLNLNEEALEESYRCPPCCLSLGNPHNPLPSSMTWRYEAQMKSQRLAAIQETSDDEDDDDDISFMDVEEQPLHMKLTLPEPIQDHSVSKHEECSRSTTPEDWSDASSESRYSSCSTSEVSTPKEHIYAGDPFEYQQENLMIDPESFEILSHLAYLQKLKDNLFSPIATDVFLCEDNSSNYSMTQPDTSTQSSSLYEALPSTICSQELSEFSFDNGPFWQPLN